MERASDTGDSSQPRDLDRLRRRRLGELDALGGGDDVTSRRRDANIEVVVDRQTIGNHFDCRRCGTRRCKLPWFRTKAQACTCLDAPLNVGCVWSEHEGTGDLMVRRPDRLLGCHEVRRRRGRRADRSALAIEIGGGDGDRQRRAVGEPRQLDAPSRSAELNGLSRLQDANAKTGWIGCASARLRPLPVDYQRAV